MAASWFAKLSIKKAIGLIIVTLCPIYYAAYRLRDARSTLETGMHAATDDFVNRWTRTSLLGPFDPSSIRQYCATTTWRPNLIFHPDTVPGGIGNIRAITLDFVFFAIDAGAAMILPPTTLRSTTDLTDLWHGELKNFGRMFDEQHFMQSMKKACPELQIYQPGEKDGQVRKIEPLHVAPSRRVDLSYGHTREDAEQLRTQWFAEQEVDPEMLSEVTVQHTFWDVDTRSLGESFRRNFGKMFVFREDCRTWAAKAVATMALKYDINLDPSDRIHAHGYYGAHLRTEQDAVDIGWFREGLQSEMEVGFDFTEQTDAYLADAAEYGLRLIYVATGNATELAHFAKKAAAASPPVTVTSKWDLLSTEDAEALSQLDWDQQALVDWEVMLRSSRFGGIAKSSFSENIIVTRMAYLEMEGRPLGTNWHLHETNPRMTFDDGLSKILGRNQIQEERGPSGFWP